MFARGQLQNGTGIESGDIVGHRDPAAGADGVENTPLGGSVHQRRKHQERPHAGCGVYLIDQILVAVQFRAAGERPTAHGRHEDVVLTPQNTLGHPGGAAGVEDVEIVAAGRGHFGGGLRCGGDGFVVDRALEQWIAGIVGHLDEHLKIG